MGGDDVSNFAGDMEERLRQFAIKAQPLINKMCAAMDLWIDGGIDRAEQYANEEQA